MSAAADRAPKILFSGPPQERERGGRGEGGGGREREGERERERERERETETETETETDRQTDILSRGTLSGFWCLYVVGFSKNNPTMYVCTYRHCKMTPQCSSHEYYKHCGVSSLMPY